MEYRELDYMPFDKVFYNEQGQPVDCHATGYEALINGEWWNEYIDSNDNLYYGR